MKTTVYSVFSAVILLLCTTWAHAQSLQTETLAPIIEYWESINDNTPEVSDIWVVYLDNPLVLPEKSIGSHNELAELEFSSNISSVAFGKDVNLSFQNIGEVSVDNIVSKAQELWDCSPQSLVYAACRIDGQYQFYQLEFVEPWQQEQAEQSLGTEVKEGIQLNMYPNPVRDQLTIELGNTQTGTIIMYDVSGRVLFEQQVQNALTRIDVQDWSPGMYVVSMHLEHAVVKKTFLISR
jgi:hypothetical protein